jgi:predicted dinucleotide-binding enzyme
VRIAVIGAGNVGTTLARAAIAAGHSVTISAAHPDRARTAAEATGATAAASSGEAARGADMVIVAVPYPALRDVAADLDDLVSGVAVVDVTNTLKPDFSGLATETSAAEELQQLLPGASVVKAFNTVLGPNQANPVVDGVTLDGFFAGDDQAAKAKVAELLEAIGYRPLDVGGLSAARGLEYMAFLNIGLNARNGWPWRSGWKLVGTTG